MRTLTIFVFLFLCVVVSESTPKKPSKPTVNKPPKGKNGQLPIFDAKPRKSTGPCLPDSTCKDPNDVCQKSDGNCFPKGTPGLNDSDNSSSSTDSDDSDDSDDSSQKKKKKRRGDGSNRPECCDRVNPLTGISECRAKRNLCNMGRFFNLMTQECARTCRRQSKCGTNPRIRSQRICTTPRPNCSDTINGQRFNRCTRIRASNNCRSRRLFNFIRINCRQTCKFC